MAKEPDLTVEQFTSLLQGPGRQNRSDNGDGGEGGEGGEIGNSAKRKNGRILGLDLGTKTIGMAISNSSWTIASPVTTIRRTKFTNDVREMLDFARSEQVEGLVMGMPLNMDGSEGPRAQATRAFVRNLRNHCDLPVLYWDERLSSYAAEQAMLEADMSRKKRAKNIDQIAAAIILQGCLDRLREVLDENTG
ncbi:MAG: Holliday junction resolvase RuvX [Rhizobiaceae bacterium]|nr:Holliday junction resolvase RuvX [Rhizobiaceae bacterium]